MELLKEALSSISPLDMDSQKKAQERLDNLIKPPGSLGRLEEICVQLAGIYGSMFFSTEKKAILAFAADHGVFEEGVSPCPQDITKIQIPNFVRGITGVGSLARFANAKIIAVDVGVNCDEELEGVINKKIRKGTSNLAVGAAMTREEAIRCLEIGIETVNDAVNEGITVVGIGEMGISNTTPTSAIISLYGNYTPLEVTGMGAGLDKDAVLKKASVIERSLHINKPDKNDPVDVLSKIGGFEIGAMAGAIIGAAAKKIPVVIDGFISYSSTLLALKLCPQVRDYIIPSHFSAEPASKKAFDLLDLKPMLTMDMRLGEGSGAALCFNLIEASNFMYKNMKTFEEVEMEYPKDEILRANETHKKIL